MLLALQGAGLVAGLLALVLAGKLGARRRDEGLSALGLATGAQVVKSLLVLVATLDPEGRSGILPPGFVSGAQGELVWFLLVAAGALFTGNALDAVMPSRGARPSAWIYVALSGLALLAMARVWLGESSGALAAGALRAPVWSLPYLLPQAFVILRGAGFLYRLRRSSLHPAAALEGSAACLIAAQLFDAVFRFTTFEAALLPFLHQGLFSCGVFLFLAAIRGQGAGRAPEEAGNPAVADPGAGLEGEAARILSAILAGASNKEIAHAEGLSLSATKHRIQAIYRSLGVASRFELMAKAGTRRLP